MSYVSVIYVARKRFYSYYENFTLFLTALSEFQGNRALVSIRNLIFAVACNLMRFKFFLSDVVDCISELTIV